MIVREATTQDIVGMTVRWKEWVNSELADPKAWFDETFAGMSTGSILSVVLVAEYEIVGFADGILAREAATGEYFLAGRHLIVDPAFRGDGWGDKLMLRLLALARQSGASSMLTHGTPTRHAVEKFLGKQMEKKYELWAVRF